MAKTLYLVNGSEPYFRGKFSITAQELDINHCYLDLKECVFFISDNETHLYHNNKEVDPSEGYFFIRKKDTDSYYCYLLTEFLHQHSASFSDPCNRSHTLSDGKIAQLLRLPQQGIPFPKSFICRPYSYTLHQDFITQELGFPCVVKRSGARGEAVWLIHSRAALEEKFNEAPFEAHIIQQYIPNDFDIRVITFKDKVLGAMKRSAIDGFANTAEDATLEIMEITEQEKKLALLTSEKAGVDFAGVDIVRTDEGPKVWEVNKTPQIERFIPATGIDIMQQTLRYIQEHYL